jgi:hypothetical protein
VRAGAGARSGRPGARGPLRASFFPTLVQLLSYSVSHRIIFPKRGIFRENNSVVWCAALGALGAANKNDQKLIKISLRVFYDCEFNKQYKNEEVVLDN